MLSRLPHRIGVAKFVSNGSQRRGGLRLVSLSGQRRYVSDEETRRIDEESKLVPWNKSIVWMLIPIIGGLGIFYKDLNILIADWTAPFPVTEVAEDIKIINTKYGSAPIFIRLAWQSACLYSDQGTGKQNGCLADSNCIYAKMPCSRGLGRPIQLLQPIKEKYPEMSWADLIALAATVSVEDLGGPRIPYSYGRVDGPLDIEKDELLKKTPDAHKGVNHVKNTFSRLGFTRHEMVALMGAHTVGGVHRFFSGVEGQQTSHKYVFDNTYFIELIENEWHPESNSGDPLVFKNKDGDLTMLPVDHALLSDPALLRIINTYAADEAMFFSHFQTAFEKLMGLGYNLHQSRWR
eukprot:TRINITY_DN3904_c0_g1_i1.p1 TRINITY_DN3904_c0_g1~~TRINITY_DN3904_c0_g1_i1.p1  ORF type:complete len:349 (+),score=46.03 TRINITY_DN3904_c0_g1_i1:57-1103(+)